MQIHKRNNFPDSSFTEKRLVWREAPSGEPMDREAEKRERVEQAIDDLGIRDAVESVLGEEKEKVKTACTEEREEHGEEVAEEINKFEWPETAVLSEPDPIIIKDKEYTLLVNADVYFSGDKNSPRENFFRKGEKVKAIGNTTTVEGRVFAQIKIEDGRHAPAFVPMGNLQIPLEDRVIFETNATTSDNTEERRNYLIRGLYNLTETMNGSQLLEALFQEDEKLENDLDKSGISRKKYVEALRKIREGNIIHIISPQKTAEGERQRFERKTENTEVQQAFREREQSITDQTNRYFSTTFRIGGSQGGGNELMEYVNDPQKWNDLWAKRGEERDNYIEGLNRVEAIFKRLGVPDNEVRDSLRDLVRTRFLGITGRRQGTITFKEVFDSLIRGKKYEGSFNRFQREVRTLSEDLKEWRTRLGEDKLKAVRELTELREKWEAEVRERKARGEDMSGRKKYSIPEYRAWAEKAEERIGGEKIAEIHKRFNDSGIEEKLNRSNHLTNEILIPVAELLEAIGELNVKQSARMSFTEEHQDLIRGIEPSRTPPQNFNSPFFDIKHLTNRASGNPDKIRIQEQPDIAAIAISPHVRQEFKDLSSTYLSTNEFTDVEILKFIFNIYSIDTLAQENCLRNTPNNENKIILVHLPRNLREKINSREAQELLGVVRTRQELFEDREGFQALSERLDNNARVLSRLNGIFGTETSPSEGMNTYFDFKEKFIARFTGADVRELSITMDDIGAGKVTLPTDEFFQRYMSGDSAIASILSRITSYEEGIETYDEERLTDHLEELLAVGLTSLLFNEDFKSIREDIEKDFGTLEESENREKVMRAFSEEMESGNLSPEIANTIRIGAVIHRIREANNEEISLSNNPEIRRIQEEMRKEGWLNRELQEVETILAGGLIVAVGEGFNLGAGGVIDLGNGWKISPHVSGGTGGIGVGIAGGRRIELSKNNRTALTLGMHGGTMGIGVGGRLVYPLGESSYDLIASVGVGVTTLGIPAGGVGLGLRKNVNAEREKKLKEAREERGFESVMDLIRKRESNEKIVNEMLKIDGYGETFKILKEENGFTNEALIETFEMLQSEIASQITTETGRSRLPFALREAGVFVGQVGTSPFILPYIRLKIGEKTVVVRSTGRGYENRKRLSDAQMLNALEEHLKDNYPSDSLQFTREKIGDTGHIVINPDTGERAVLESENKIDLQEFHSTNQFERSLRAIDIDFRAEGNGFSIRALTPRAMPTNIKYVIDPMLGNDVAISNNRVFVAGVDTQGVRDFIITKENFHYPYRQSGNTIMSVVTIKKNPLRRRTDIEEESTHYLFQRGGYRLEERRGLNRVSGRQNIKELSEIEGFPGGIEVLDADKLEELEGLQSGLRTGFEELREDFSPRDFAEEYLKDTSRLREYRRLTTQGEQTTENYNELTSNIQEFAKEKGLKPLNTQELNDVMLNMLGISFADIPARRKIEALKRHLEIAINRVFKPLFEENQEKLGLSNTDIADMLNRIKQDIGRTDFENPRPETFERGTFFLSMVGMDNIVGLRGTTNYKSNLDTLGEIINLNDYPPSAPGVRGQIGRALLEIFSPVETLGDDDTEFMKSPLALKLAESRALFLLIGMENAISVARSFNNKEVAPKDKQAFDNFKETIKNIRQAQNRGANYHKLPNGYILKLETSVGMGTYDRCTNPTIVGTENIKIYPPTFREQAHEMDHYINLNAEVTRQEIEIFLGLKIDFAPPEEIPPEEIPPEEPAPEAGPGGEVSGETGGEMYEVPRPGQTPSGPQGETASPGNII